MESIQLEKINKELITFTKSDFLKNEINQAFFIWNQNEFYTKDFSDISPEDPRYPLFLDWFIYDYVIISTKKSLAEMYWEDNKDKIDAKILTTYRSIYKFKKLEGDIYLIDWENQELKQPVSIELFRFNPNDYNKTFLSLYPDFKNDFYMLSFEWENELVKRMKRKRLKN